MAELIRAKAIMEFRYPGAGRFHDVRGDIASSFQSDIFPHWSINQLKVDIHSEDKRYTAFVTSKNAGLSITLPQSRGEIQEFVRSYSGLIIRRLRLDGLVRMGFRLFLVVPEESMEVAKALHEDRIFSPIRDSLTELGEITDYAEVLDLTVRGLKGHFRAGPMRREQLLEILEADLDEEIRETLPEAMQFIDFDIFEDNPNPGRRIEQYIVQFANAQWGEIVSRTSRYLESLGYEIGD